MSIDGFAQAEITNVTLQYRIVTYTYAAAVALVVYDSLILFHKEVKYIYSGPRSLAKWIYLFIKVMGVMMFLLNFFTYYTSHNDATFCWARQWIAGFLFEVGDTAIIKILLVMRLRALYHNSRRVTLVLCITTAAELISTTYAYITASLNIQWYTVAPAPVPGCPLGSQNTMNFFHPPAVAWSARLVTNSLELLLLLIGLYRSLKDSRYHFQKGQMRMRQIAPVLYVFYRDGTMFYIPVFGLSAFGFIASFDAHINAQLQACANWEAWLAIAYYICGTRLILNIRSAGMKFTTSMITQHISSLVFDRGSSVESDDECPDHPKTVLGIGQGHGAGLVTA